MSRDSRSSRIRQTAAAAALIALLAGCGHPSNTSTPEPTATTQGPVGAVHVTDKGVDLRISHAEAHLDASGSGSLSMTVENSGSVTEHLAMVATPEGGRGALSGGRGKGTGAMTTAGIQILPGGRTGFGTDHGPRVHIARTHGVTHRGTLPMALEFGVVGLVRLQARVTHG